MIRFLFALCHPMVRAFAKAAGYRVMPEAEAGRLTAEASEAQRRAVAAEFAAQEMREKIDDFNRDYGRNVRIAAKRLVNKRSA